MFHLTEQEVATYRDEGLIVPNHRLPDSVLMKLRGLVDKIIDENPDIRPENLRNIHLPSSDGRVENRETAELFLAQGSRSEILDFLEQLIGPDIILWASQLFCKPENVGMEVPWHQDSQYWPMKPLAACTVWIAIDDATAENGCLRYIPGSHKLGLLPHHADKRCDVALSQTLAEGSVDTSLARNNVLNAGQFSIHDVHLVHGSRANTSGERRAGLAFRYMPATSHFDRDFKPYSGQGGRLPATDYVNRPLYVVRGVNRNPKTTMVTHLC